MKIIKLPFKSYLIFTKYVYTFIFFNKKIQGYFTPYDKKLHFTNY